jgi:glucose-1-phosphate adenylyltransferase
LGNGKDWDLARKDGGIILLPPFSEAHDKLYTTRLEALTSLTGFLMRRTENYVVLTDCDYVARLDIADIIACHEKNNADMTLVTRKGTTTKKSDYMVIDANE